MADCKRLELKTPACLTDFDAYISNYKGEALVRRLKLIAERVPELQVPAFRSALAQIKQGGNTQAYIDSVQQGVELFGSVGDEWLDVSWIDARKRKYVDQFNKIQAALKEAKRIAEPDQIRNVLLDLATHYNDIGEYNKSISALVESMEISMSPQQQAATQMQIIEVSVNWGTLSHVTSQANRLRQNRGSVLKSNPVWEARVAASVALHQLKSGNYLGAATSFLGIQQRQLVGDKIPELVSAKDIGQYSCILALATMGRAELKARVLESVNFRGYLELVPLWSKVIEDFVKGEYASCFATLDQLKGDLLVDLYMHTHVESLYKIVMEKAFTQYFRPFSAVKLDRMSAAFHMSVAALESMLISLIADNRIQARIDSQNKVLYARHADQRNASYQQAMKIGNVFCRDVQFLLLRTSLVQNNFFIRKEITAKHPNQRSEVDY